MPSASNFDLYFSNVMTLLCENFRSITCWKVMLQLAKVKELDVRGSLVLSNLVTYTVVVAQTKHDHCIQL